MSVVAFAKTQMEVARHIGRKDFDGAIRVLEGSLSHTPTDIPFLEMIALCYRWSHRNDMAIPAAQQALAYDANNFGAVRLLSEIYAERNEYDTAARFVRLGLESYPEPLANAKDFLLGSSSRSDGLPSPYANRRRCKTRSW